MTDRHQFALELAKKAGAILRDGFYQEKSTKLKGDRDLVTEFDLRSEKFIIQQIEESYPQDGILAEEGGARQGSTGRWVIDPLDGTTNYAHGIPVFVVSIAFESDKGTELGVIYDPMRDECFHARLGVGAWLEDRPIQVSKAEQIEESLLATGYSHNSRDDPENILKQYSLAAKRAQAVRRLGSAALELAYVAAGRLDGYWEAGLSPWDWAAGILLIQEAGGRVSRIDGGEGIHQGSPSLLAANTIIHNAMIHLFQVED
jgi:myo-inositol-1(or 4)-monophosphatase